MQVRGSNPLDGGEAIVGIGLIADLQGVRSLTIRSPLDADLWGRGATDSLEIAVLWRWPRICARNEPWPDSRPNGLTTRARHNGSVGQAANCSGHRPCGEVAYDGRSFAATVGQRQPRDRSLTRDRAIRDAGDMKLAH